MNKIISFIERFLLPKWLRRYNYSKNIEHIQHIILKDHRKYSNKEMETIKEMMDSYAEYWRIK